MERSGSITRFEEAALSLAERGYHVFPCQPRSKKPLTPHGFKDSSRDERQILHWWDAHPDANIGVDCGGSGILVFDIDAKHGADPEDVLAERDTHGAPIVLTGEAPERSAEHPRSLTGTRGAQVFFRGAARTTDKLTIPGTEIRSIGAYVIVPPSAHPSGVAYEGELPATRALPEAPAWLLEAVIKANGTAAAAIADKIPKGEQHKTLVSIAGSMRRRGMGADEIEAALLVTNTTRLEVPAPRDHIRRIAESVAKYPPGEAINGALHVPRLPEDAQAAADSLGELLDLPSVDVKIKAARVFGKGSGAQVEIDLSNDETMTFGALRDMMRPQTLIAEVAACAGARPHLKQIQCAEALTLTKVLAQFVPTDSENDVAREWGRDYLELAETIDVNMADQVERWGAFERLAHRNPNGHGHNGGGIELATAGIVLRHIDGTRFVRTLWFERYVKSRDAGVSRIAVSARMARVGWERRGRHGDIKATAPGRSGTRIYPFWIVPPGWMAEEEAAA